MKIKILFLFAVIFCTKVNSQTLNPTQSINAAGSVNTFKGGYTFAYATSGAPWNGALLSFGGLNNNYDCQFSTEYYNGLNISFRTRNGDLSRWNSWNQLWHSANLNNSTSDFICKNLVSMGNVGIGTNIPAAALELNRAFGNDVGIKLHQPGSSVWDIKNTATSGIFTIGAGGSSYFNIARLTGNVGIGTTNPDQKLTVKGKIHSEEVIVDLLVPADYVFEKYYTGKSNLKADYQLPTLAEVENYTKENHHLPNVPSAETIKEKGLQLGEMSNILLQKIEELTLYVIEQNKKIKVLEQKLNNK